MALSDLLAGLKAEAAAEEAELEAETSEEVSRIDEAAQAEARMFQEGALRAPRASSRGRRSRGGRGAAGCRRRACVRRARRPFSECLAEVRRRLDAVRERLGVSHGAARAAAREPGGAPTATVLRVDPRDERLAAELLAELGR